VCDASEVAGKVRPNLLLGVLVVLEAVFVGLGQREGLRELAAQLELLDVVALAFLIQLRQHHPHDREEVDRQLGVSAWRTLLLHESVEHLQLLGALLRLNLFKQLTQELEGHVTDVPNIPRQQSQI